MRPLQVGAFQIIPDDDYDSWGNRTDYPADTTDPNVRPRTRVGIATTAPGKPYLLFAVDSGSAEWKDIAQAAWSAFVGREQRAVSAWLERAVCSQAPMGADCDGPVDRRRLEAAGRMPRGHPLDSIQRARGTVGGVFIWGTAPIPVGLALYHTELKRSYPRIPADSSCPVSYFTANVVKRAAGLAVTDAGIGMAGCDDEHFSGTTPLAVFLLGGRVFVMVNKWAWEMSDFLVRELTDTGLVKTGDLGLRDY